ncbi:MAG: aldo/keto reductase, partial [Sphingobacteriaceae bacterium]
GKYSKTESGTNGTGRLSGNNPFGNQKFTDKNWAILDVLKTVATQLNRPPAQVALAWVTQQKGITSTIIGARSSMQLQDNLAALDIVFTDEQLTELDKASALEVVFPYGIFSPAVKKSIFGGNDVNSWF